MRIFINTEEKRVVSVLSDNATERVALPDSVTEVSVATADDFWATYGEWEGASELKDQFPSFTVEGIVAKVSGMVEAKRAQFVTAGSGQALTYVLKQQQLAAFREAGNAGAQAVSPILYAEANATGTTPQALANVWEAKQAAWVAVATKIEAAKFAAIDAADAAVTNADAKEVIDNLARALAAIG